MTCEYFISDTKTLELTLTETEVPSAVSTLTCQAFTLPADVTDGDFHMVGMETIVVNHKMLHHMAVLGCLREKGMHAQFTRDPCRTVIDLQFVPKVFAFRTMGFFLNDWLDIKK